MITQLLRPLVNWVFWNRRGPVLLLAGLFIVLALVVRFAAGGSAAPGHATGRGTAPAATAPAAPASASTLASASAAASAPQIPSASPSASGPPPAAALQDADAFLRAWASRSADRTARIRATATAQLAGQVTGPAAGLAPATSLDSGLTVTSQAAGTVSVSVQTNAGTALLTVRLTNGSWRAAQVMLAKTGD